MNRNHAFLVPPGLLLLCLGMGGGCSQTASKAPVAVPAKSELEVAIAIPQGPSDPYITIYIQPDSHFHVVFTNLSDKPLNFMQDRNSWGYDALRFEADDNQGHRYVIQKPPVAWADNGPAFWTLKPGEHLVIDVNFGSKEFLQKWVGLPEVNNSKFTMKAVYEIHDVAAARQPVWNGRIESQPITCWLREIPPQSRSD